MFFSDASDLTLAAAENAAKMLMSFDAFCFSLTFSH